MYYLNMLVSLSKSELEAEKKIELMLEEVNEKLDLAIGEHPDIYTGLLSQYESLINELEKLQGGVRVTSGKKLPNNSNDLARALIIKADELDKREELFFEEIITETRQRTNEIKSQIEGLVAEAEKRELNKKFSDFNYVIEFWKVAKVDVFTKQGEELVSAWDHLCNQKMDIKTCNNYISYLITKLRKLEDDLLNLELKKTNLNQLERLKSTCERVLISTDDNEVYRELFLMGQFTSDLNHMELQINEYNAKYKAKQNGSRPAKWAGVLAQQLYIDYWVHGEKLGPKYIMKEYLDFTDQKSAKTVGEQMRKFRDAFSKFDYRVKSKKRK